MMNPHCDRLWLPHRVGSPNRRNDAHAKSSWARGRDPMSVSRRPGVREAVGPFWAAYTERVLKRVSTRALPVLNRAAEIAPATQACCGVCRTCVTTNIFGVLAFAAGALVSPLARFARRVDNPS